ncbi:MAG: hypothetical protein HKM24_03050, partial [Gammaproteobacteria bacterium]|nr:hypothetical protein [Gammaproteobacteria bacterium]
CMLSPRGLLPKRDVKHLREVLANYQQLEIIDQFRQRLSDIWQQAAGCNEDLLKRLKEWCTQAEQSGVRLLADFSEYLQSFSTAEAVTAKA